MSPPVAIITGASQGIGAGLVAGYRGAGYAVVGVALSFRPADPDESDYIPIAGDIADAQTARRAVDQARDHFGRVDTLITTPASTSANRSRSTRSMITRRSRP